MRTRITPNWVTCDKCGAFTTADGITDIDLSDGDRTMTVSVCDDCMDLMKDGGNAGQRDHDGYLK